MSSLGHYTVDVYNGDQIKGQGHWVETTCISFLFCSVSLVFPSFLQSLLNTFQETQAGGPSYCAPWIAPEWPDLRR